MNDYLTPMTDAILDSEGTVDKLSRRDHGVLERAARHARASLQGHFRRVGDAVGARGVQRDARRQIARGRRRAPDRVHGNRRPVGSCSVGNMGSARRFDYSVLGDTVNLASRLEGVSKMFDVDIIASASAREGAKDCAWLDLGEVVVVGRNSPTAVFNDRRRRSLRARAGVFANEDVARRNARALRGETLRRGRRDRDPARGALSPRWRGLYIRLGIRLVP